jgi:hypothetical protein
MYNNTGPIYSVLTGKGDGYLCQGGLGCAPCYSCLGGPNTYADLNTCQQNCIIRNPLTGCGPSANCPEGYCRYSTCVSEQDPSYNPTMMSCGYPTQINCYTYVVSDSESSLNCISYCDNV